MRQTSETNRTLSLKKNSLKVNDFLRLLRQDTFPSASVRGKSRQQMAIISHQNNPELLESDHGASAPLRAADQGRETTEQMKKEPILFLHYRLRPSGTDPVSFPSTALRPVSGQID
jgi:hypothetical protein